MSLFLEVLQTPALPQAKIDLYKSQVQDLYTPHPSVCFLVRTGL